MTGPPQGAQPAICVAPWSSRHWIVVPGAAVTDQVGVESDARRRGSAVDRRRDGRAPVEDVAGRGRGARRAAPGLRADRERVAAVRLGGEVVGARARAVAPGGHGGGAAVEPALERRAGVAGERPLRRRSLPGDDGADVIDGGAGASSLTNAGSVTKCVGVLLDVDVPLPDVGRRERGARAASSYRLSRFHWSPTSVGFGGYWSHDVGRDRAADPWSSSPAGRRRRCCRRRSTCVWPHQTSQSVAAPTAGLVLILPRRRSGRTRCRRGGSVVVGVVIAEVVYAVALATVKYSDSCLDRRAAAQHVVPLHGPRRTSRCLAVTGSVAWTV